MTNKTIAGLFTLLPLLSASAQDPIHARGDAPPNDECTGAVEQALALEDMITFSGDNTGANELEGTPFVVVWEAFTLDECANITIHHCNDGFVYQTFLNTMTNNCPDVFEGQLTATTIEECTLVFQDVSPGTWYVPVLVDEDQTPVGEYMFSISATSCIPPYCTAEGSSQATTGSINGIMLPGFEFSGASTAMGHMDHLEGSAILGTGQSHGIMVSLEAPAPEDASDSVVVLIWIDLDQDGDLNGPGELVFIGIESDDEGNFSGDIAIPQSAMLGQTRMRIRLHDVHDGSAYPNEPNVTPCGTSTYGQVHDLMVDILLGTAIEEEDRYAMTIFPNPATDMLWVRGTEGTAYLQVLDATGRMVHDVVVNAMAPGNSLLLLPSHLSNGRYLLRCTGETGTAVSSFIITGH